VSAKKTSLFEMKPLTPEQFAKLARQVPRDERVPYAFEKRVMANLTSVFSQDPLTQWGAALWRAVAPCLAVTIIAAFVSFTQATEVSADLDVALETAVLTPPEPTLDLEP
jgi:hypothetical protein